MVKPFRRVKGPTAHLSQTLRFSQDMLICLQFFNGFLSIAAAQHTQEAAGVAWWAHVGGFLFGALVGLIARRSVRERVTPYAVEGEAS